MYTFRFAEEDDCSLILRFIRGLADYEKMSDQVVATEGASEEYDILCEDPLLRRRKWIFRVERDKEVQDKEEVTIWRGIGGDAPFSGIDRFKTERTSL